MPHDAFELPMPGDLAPGGMVQMEHGGSKILLTREGDRIHAVGAMCPHAGAPLAEGVRHGNRVVCPWHKATFCLRTGAVLEPPALDPLQRYEAIQLGGHLILRPAEPEPAADRPVDSRCFVIVGAGAAGAVAAQTLRQSGFSGRVLMVDAVNRVPYDRTVLSKYALSGEKGAEKTPLQSQAFYDEHAIERLTAEIIGLDPAARRLLCADGSGIGYDAVLLATGSAPIRPDLPGAGLRHVYTLRSRADADAIVAQAERSHHAVVLGASFIGMEVAASLRERGLAVTVVGRDQAPFSKQLGAEIGRAFVGLHERHGVAFRLGSTAVAIDGDRHVEGVTLDGGERIPADLVVAGFGVEPVTGYAGSLPRSADGGILVDANLRAVDGVYVAGDIARFPVRGDGPAIRVEHWRVAEQQGRLAALNMLGHSTPFHAVPVFWTIQYRKRLDYIGHATEWDDIVLHGDLTKPEFLAYYVKDGRVAAAAGFGRDQDTAALTLLLDMRREWQPGELGERPAAVLAALQ